MFRRRKKILPEDIAKMYLAKETLRLMNDFRPKDYNIRFIAIYIIVIWILASILTITINV